MIKIKYSNSEEVLPSKVIEFPAGEVQFRGPVVERGSKVKVIARVDNSVVVVALLMALDSLSSQGVSGIDLVLPYLPFSRQDRIAVEGEALSIRVFMRMLDPFPINSITTYDAHSMVAQACWLGHFIDVSPESFVLEFMERVGLKKRQYILLAPDAGAAKKYANYSMLEPAMIASCNKHRDPSTGKLKIDVPHLMPGFPVLVIDDIYDGGGTFKMIAQNIRPNPMYLFVTHGIFSRGITEIELQDFEAVGTLNTYYENIGKLAEDGVGRIHNLFIYNIKE